MIPGLHRVTPHGGALGANTSDLDGNRTPAGRRQVQRDR
jgi:hypothetical protein